MPMSAYLNENGTYNALNNIVNRLLPQDSLVDYNLGQVTSKVVKGSPASLYSLAVVNTVNTTRYLLFFNALSQPSTGAVPLFTWPINAYGLLAIGQDFFGGGGEYYGTGLTYAISTTVSTYTPAMSSDCIVRIVYK